MPFGDAAEDRVLAVERRLIGHADEELRPAAVRPARLEHRRHRAARRALRAELRLQHAEPAGAVQLRLGRILRQRIAALDDAEPDDAMEDRPVVGAVARQLDEVADVIRREVRPQIDDERSRRVVLTTACLRGHLRSVSGVVNGPAVDGLGAAGRRCSAAAGGATATVSINSEAMIGETMTD